MHSFLFLPPTYFLEAYGLVPQKGILYPAQNAKTIRLMHILLNVMNVCMTTIFIHMFYNIG